MGSNFYVVDVLHDASKVSQSPDLIFFHAPTDYGWAISAAMSAVSNIRSQCCVPLVLNGNFLDWLIC